MVKIPDQGQYFSSISPRTPSVERIEDREQVGREIEQCLEKCRLHGRWMI
jgi:hypothetical protein